LLENAKAWGTRKIRVKCQERFEEWATHPSDKVIPQSRAAFTMRLKIAAAIFVVMVVAVLIVFNIPNWLYEVVRQGRTERTIYELTPDLVISRCGQPISENTTDNPAPQGTAAVMREMSYKGGMGTVQLTFYRTDVGTKQGKWVLGAMNDSVGHFRYGTGKSKLNALPCLAGK
jgi:hypothetical protein